MNTLKVIYIFYIMKLAPRYIDHSKYNWFWKIQIDLLNSLRKKSGDKFYLDIFLGYYLRDPYSHPTKPWHCSEYHPFCWY